jgi:hypothetical protein
MNLSRPWCGQLLVRRLRPFTNAAASIEITGDRHLHGWLQHRFPADEQRYQLIARARQFSSFLVIVGTMAGADTFDPNDAIIL